MSKKRQPRKVSEKFVVYDVMLSIVYYDEDFNCRDAISPASVASLSNSIQEDGLQFPIILQPIADIPDAQLRARLEAKGYEYRIVAGHRRFKSYKFLKLETIPAMIRENLTARQSQIINFTENLERSDLNMLEEAKVIRKLYPQLGSKDGDCTLRGAGKEMKKSPRWIEARLRLLDMPEEVQKMFASGRIAKHFLDNLWRLKTPEERLATANELTKASKVDRHTGKTRIIHDKLPENLRRNYTKTSRSKAEIMKMMVKLLDASIIGLAPRVGAWCAGYITTEELLEDLRKRAHHFKALGVEEREI
jgi:ParB/RepB/Spo0J family partition protein